jgi:hypothetical protein
MKKTYNLEAFNQRLLLSTINHVSATEGWVAQRDGWLREGWVANRGMGG